MLVVKFTDGELIQNPSWNSMPMKPIQRVKYVIGDKTIIMEGYESYNHLVEKVYTPLDGQQFNRAIYLMGLYGINVQVIKLNLMEKKIDTEETVFGKEYKGRSSTGWKNGYSAGKPQYEII
jgi:hypothetical protein